MILQGWCGFVLCCRFLVWVAFKWLFWCFEALLGLVPPCLKKIQCDTPFDRHLSCLLTDVRANFQCSVVGCLNTLDCAIDLLVVCPFFWVAIGTLVALVLFLYFFHWRLRFICHARRKRKKNGSSLFLFALFFSSLFDLWCGVGSGVCLMQANLLLHLPVARGRE